MLCADKFLMPLSATNEILAQYRNSKIDQGTSYYFALGHIAHKLTRIIFALLTKMLRLI